MTRKRVLPALLLLLIPFLSGCPKDPYTSAMQASLQVSDAVAQAIPIIQQLQSNNLITADEARQVYGYLNTVTTGNVSFRGAVRAAHTAGQSTAAPYLAAASTFVQGINSAQALAAIHITNPQSQEKVMLYLQAISTVLNGIQTVINNNSTAPNPAPAPVSTTSLGGLQWILSNDLELVSA
jgi:hypothetical protein